ncbi:InlB B-repeat-containing protein, partial [Candidatus Darwinibacter acetoxidans]
MNRFRHTVSVLSLVMVLLLLAGCLPKAGVTEYTLTVNVKPEGAAEVKDVAEKYAKNVVATFKLIANEGYEFVGWEGDVKPTETDDGQWQIRMDGDKTLTAVFEEIEEEDIEELIAAAEAAIEALPEEITLEDADQVAEARELVNAVLAIDEDAEIEGIEKLEAAEEALQTLGWNPVNEDLVADALKKANVGLDLKTAFEGEELVLPEELTVGAYSYVLIWTTDSPDVVEIEEGKAKITRPEETTTVTLTATLGYDISAQAETKPQSFDVQIKVWGLVSELKSLADAGEDEDKEKEFEELLEILVPDYDKNLVEEYQAAIVDRLKLETKEELLQVIAAVNTRVLYAVNKAVAAYFAATTKSKREKALEDLGKAVTALDQKEKVKD